MRRRDLILGLGSVLAAPFAARAQPKALPVIGVLTTANIAFWSSFLDGLEQTGYRDGQNVSTQFAYTTAGELPAVAAGLIRRKVDLIVAFGTAEARAAKAATDTIPVVFQAGDPVIEGLVGSLAHPGANLTGVSLMDAELMAKRLDLLSQLVPRARTFVLLVNPNGAKTATVTSSTRDAARAKGIELGVLRAGTSGEIDSAFAALSPGKAGGLIVDDDRFLDMEAVQGDLPRLAARHRLPAIYGWSNIVWAGGLMSYGPDRSTARRQMGVYAGRILKGEKPADLPVVQPDRVELAINLKTAKALRLAVPQALLARADEVIE